MQDDGKLPLWARGDSERGVALWDMGEDFALVVHKDGEETPLRFSREDAESLHEALAQCLAKQDAAAVESVPAGKRGPPCDRCKNPTVETGDGYSCSNCGNVIVWV